MYHLPCVSYSARHRQFFQMLPLWSYILSKLAEYNPSLYSISSLITALHLLREWPQITQLCICVSLEMHLEKNRCSVLVFRRKGWIWKCDKMCDTYSKRASFFLDDGERVLGIEMWKMIPKFLTGLMWKGMPQTERTQRWTRLRKGKGAGAKLELRQVALQTRVVGHTIGDVQWAV